MARKRSNNGGAKQKALTEEQNGQNNQETRIEIIRSELIKYIIVEVPSYMPLQFDPQQQQIYWAHAGTRRGDVGGNGLDKSEEEADKQKAEEEDDETVNTEDEEEEPDDDCQDIHYVCKMTMESLQEKLKRAEEVTKDIVNQLGFPENTADGTAVMVDMRGVEKAFDGIRQMIEKLGPKETAKALLQAKEYYDANKETGEGAAMGNLEAKEYHDANKNNFEGEDESNEEEEGESDEEESEEDSQYIAYVCKKTLEKLHEKLKKAEKVTKDMVNDLTLFRYFDGGKLNGVRIDMRSVDEHFDDIEQMVEKLGPKRAAEAILKATEMQEFYS